MSDSKTTASELADAKSEVDLLTRHLLMWMKAITDGEHGVITINCDFIKRLVAELRRLEKFEVKIAKEDIDDLLEKWDETKPELQREIMTVMLYRSFMENKLSEEHIAELEAALKSRVLRLRGMTHLKATTNYQCGICCESAADKNGIKHKSNCILAKEQTDG